MIEISWHSITAKTIFIAIYSDYIALDSPNNSKCKSYKKWVCDKFYSLMYRLFYFLKPRMARAAIEWKDLWSKTWHKSAGIGK